MLQFYTAQPGKTSPKTREDLPQVAKNDEECKPAGSGDGLQAPELTAVSETTHFLARYIDNADNTELPTLLTRTGDNLDTLQSPTEDLGSATSDSNAALTPEEATCLSDDKSNNDEGAGLNRSELSTKDDAVKLNECTEGNTKMQETTAAEPAKAGPVLSPLVIN